MSFLATRAAGSLARPIAALFGSMISLTIGTSIAKQLFPIVGAPATVALRIALAALVLGLVWRPWRRPLGAPDIAGIALYGLVLGAMNTMFYMALRTIPLGLAIAIELTGPLAVALLASRHKLDLVWIALAGLGLALLLPLPTQASALDPAGIAFALGAAICWGLYIVFGKRIGHLHGGQVVALGLATATLVTLPLGLATAGLALASPGVLATGLVVALLSSAIPYSLEIYALKHLPKQTFGLLLSLEPAFGALAAMILLGETLTAGQWAAIACIVAACAGNTWTAQLRAREIVLGT